MKKLYCLLLSAMLVLISISYVYTKSAPKDLVAPIGRKASKHLSAYDNSRVKTMCEELSECKEWVAKRAAEEEIFVVTDMEVERRIDRWEGTDAIWWIRLHVKTREKSKNMANIQEKAYYFEPTWENRKHSFPSIPTKEEKFPGHPIKDFPSKHARYHYSMVGNDSLARCLKWDECKKLLEQKRTFVSKAVESQYIYGLDENGNAIWARNLYIQAYYWDGEDSFAFRAKQKKAGGEYTFEKPQKILQCPNHPDF